MSRQYTGGEEESLGEFVQTTLAATGQKVGEWLDRDNNLDLVLMTSFAGFSALAAAAETAANLLSKREGWKARAQRGALHVTTLGSLAGAGASLLLEGAALADDKR